MGRGFTEMKHLPSWSRFGAFPAARRRGVRDLEPPRVGSQGRSPRFLKILVAFGRSLKARGRSPKEGRRPDRGHKLTARFGVAVGVAARRSLHEVIEVSLST